MYMRLGFAVAINVDPDVLLVDEVLAVGDEAFTHKCLDKFAEFRRRGKTVLLVTHSLDLVHALLRRGAVAGRRPRPRCRAIRSASIDAYLLDVADAESRQLSQAASGNARIAAVDHGRARTGAVPDMSKAVGGALGLARGGDRRASSLRRPTAPPAHVFQSGDPVEIRMQVHAHQPLRDFVFGVGIFNADGVCCYGTNTHIEGAHAGRADRATREVALHIDAPRSRRRHLQARRRRAPRERRALRLPPPAATRFA